MTNLIARAGLLLVASTVVSLGASGGEQMQVRRTLNGQADIVEGGKPVLQYNYATVEPGDVLARISEPNQIYARARSDYIHPLYGLGGEVLTRDWSVDHPHHRGIYWAWPEVDYGSRRGDLHALQKVFARPTGKLRVQSGANFAEIEAENNWVWENDEAIVRETATIRAHRANKEGRIVDLTFKFVALKEGVTVARRGTEYYGGLNVRMATPRQQSIITNTSPAGSTPVRAWSDLSGMFSEGPKLSGLMVMQHPGNPCYPGDWIQYPELSWCQPTFPSVKMRYPLSTGEPLVLRYRLWIHAGGSPNMQAGAELWDAFAATREE